MVRKLKTSKKIAARHFPADLEERRKYFRSQGYEFRVTPFIARVEHCGQSVSSDVTNPNKNKRERLGEAWLTALLRADSHMKLTGFVDERESTDSDSWPAADGDIDLEGLRDEGGQEDEARRQSSASLGRDTDLAA